jgi:glycyl-tRNA synthetase alpha subunit
MLFLLALGVVCIGWGAWMTSRQVDQLTIAAAVTEMDLALLARKVAKLEEQVNAQYHHGD